MPSGPVFVHSLTQHYNARQQAMLAHLFSLCPGAELDEDLGRKRYGIHISRYPAANGRREFTTGQINVTALEATRWGDKTVGEWLNSIPMSFNP